MFKFLKNILMLLEKSFKRAIGIEWMKGGRDEKGWGTDAQNQVYKPTHLNQWIRESRGKNLTNIIKTEERLEKYVETAGGGV